MGGQISGNDDSASDNWFAALEGHRKVDASGDRRGLSADHQSPKGVVERIRASIRIPGSVEEVRI